MIFHGLETKKNQGRRPPKPSPFRLRQIAPRLSIQIARIAPSKDTPPWPSIPSRWSCKYYLSKYSRLKYHGFGSGIQGGAFTPSNREAKRTVAIFAKEDTCSTDDFDTIPFSWEGRAFHSLVIVVMDNDKDDAVKSRALAIPSPESGDDAALRIRYKQNTPCPIAFDRSARTNGTTFEGILLEPIPA